MSGEGFDAGIRFGGTVPEELRDHVCIQLRSVQGVIYKWEFRKGNEYRAIDAPGQVCVSETTLAIELALAGSGIAYCLEDRVAQHLKAGTLRVVLANRAPVETAMYLCYPCQRQTSQGLKELIALLREEIAAEKRLPELVL